MLLWGQTERGTRGPKPGLSVEQIVRAAIEVADAEGVDALSMRRVADKLGVGTMSLYRYVPGKGELIDLMLERVLADNGPPGGEPTAWRPRLESMARSSWRMYHEQHPRVLVTERHPVMGPTEVEGLESLLRAVSGIGLSPSEMYGAIALVDSFVRGMARYGVDARDGRHAHGGAGMPGGDIPVTIGDMASSRAPGELSLVYLVYSAITCLLTQDQQVACFGNAARHLRPGGRFVIEVFVPDLQRLPPGETARPFHVGQHHLGFDTFDLVNQRLVSHHYSIEDGTVRTFRSPHRFVWPSELDLMARLAGLDLRERWADWNQTAFPAASTSHVSVWQKPHAEPAEPGTARR